jgi:Fe2+ transport system protein FeoA
MAAAVGGAHPAGMRSAPRLALGVAIGVASVALLAAGVLAVVSTVFRHTERSSHVLRGDVSSVVVEVASGDVALRSGPAGRVTVAEKRRYWLRKPKLELSLARGVLTVRVECSWFGPDCSDDLRITAPPGVDAAVVDVDSGDVSLRAFDAGRVVARTDSGDVSVRSAPGALDVRADSGDVAVALLVAPRALSAHTDPGDVDLDVPSDRYRVVADADSGDVSLDGLLRDDRAVRHIDARSDSGDVTVRGR